MCGRSGTSCQMKMMNTWLLCCMKKCQLHHLWNWTDSTRFGDVSAILQRQNWERETWSCVYFVWLHCSNWYGYSSFSVPEDAWSVQCTTDLKVYRTVCLPWTSQYVLYGFRVIRVSHPTNVLINLQSKWHMTFLKAECQLLLLSPLPVQWKWLQR